MFIVRKSTYDMQRANVALLSQALEEASARANKAEQRAQLAVAALDMSEKQVVQLNTALAQTWVRNARGHFERHPLNKGTGK